MHFLVKLVLAAPLSFLSAADASHAAWVSVSHFFMKLLSAAPASFLSVACDLQVVGAGGLCAWTLPPRRQPTITSGRMRMGSSMGSVMPDRAIARERPMHPRRARASIRAKPCL